MRLVFSGLAETDLESIGDWIARDSPRRAESFVRELRRVCQSFCVHPRRAPVARMVGGRELRRAVHRAYLVYFAIDDARNEVTIVRIVHGARDQGATFSEQTPGQ